MRGQLPLGDQVIETTLTGGKLIFLILGALTEFERDVIRGQTNASFTAARGRGRFGGRPKAITDPRKIDL